MKPTSMTPFAWLSALLIAALTLAACAQPLPMQPMQSNPPGAPEAGLAEPPGRIGRLAWVSGEVDLITEGVAEPASLNWPITSGQQLATGAAGRAEVRIGSASFRLDADTEVDFARIDDEAVQVQLRRGVLQVTARSREWLREIDLATPRARIELLAPGRYRIEALPGRSLLATLEGDARLLAQRMSFTVHAGEAGELTSEPYASFRMLAYTPSSFDDWAAARDRRSDTGQSLAYVSPETPGIESLDDYGRWQSVDEVGAVWFPTTVVADWAPYRHGRWAWVAPWGWTWIDAAPWGFAPFHYGRWVWVGRRWGWSPGARPPHRPVYAPALVAWHAAPGAGRPVGWVPLAPGEAFRPWYRVSRPHLEVINRGAAPRPGSAGPAPDYRHHRTPGAATWIPAQDFGRRPPQRVLMPPPADARPAPNPPPADRPPAFPRPVPPATGVQAPTRPETGRPDFGRPDFNRPAAPRPELQRPESPRPEAQRPDWQRPEPQRPDAPRPDAGRPEWQPGSPRPGWQRPEAPRPTAPAPAAPAAPMVPPASVMPPSAPAPALPAPRPDFAAPAPREEPRPYQRGEPRGFERGVERGFDRAHERGAERPAERPALRPSPAPEAPRFAPPAPPPAAPAPVAAPQRSERAAPPAQEAAQERKSGREPRGEGEKFRPGEPRERRQAQ